ncbi:MAG TPA: hypothetical protein VEW46_19385 [Pyrinomonadaceae bacterium]|nr:hypothetical protein [Pyrinomonadaceae bacterium]
MLRICLKCGAYSADHTLTFCLVDGMPLVRVIPGTKNWSHGTRVVEENEKALKKEKRRLKWRRVLVRAMMTLITTTVVCLVAVSSLKITTTPAPERTQALVPNPSQTPALVISIMPTPRATSTPTPTPTATATPTPTRSRTLNFTATPTPTPIPTPTPTPSPTPRLQATPSPTVVITPTPKPECTEDDKTGEQKRIQQSVVAMLPPLTKGAVGYQIAFSDCKNAVVRVEFWENADNPNGLVKRERKEKRFICRKLLGFWQCGRL